MNLRNERRDRRGETRQWAADRITWRRPEASSTFRGWLSDESRSSLSFITASSPAPMVGEVLELSGSDRSSRRLEVARVAPYDRTLSFVACREIVHPEIN